MLNSEWFYKLPEYTDDEFNTVKVYHRSLPSFVTFINNLYAFRPTSPNRDIMKHSIIGYLDDSNLKTEFIFFLTVYNDPPFFE